MLLLNLVQGSKCCMQGQQTQAFVILEPAIYEYIDSLAKVVGGFLGR